MDTTTRVPRPSRLVTLRWEPYDNLVGLTTLAAGGLVVGVALAVFGLPTFDSHGPLYHLGIMSPICGGTRAVYHALRGDLALSWQYNPSGIPLVLGAMLLLVRHLAGVVTGRWLNLHIRARRLVVALGVVALVVLEVNQQAHAAFLLAS